MPISIAKIAIKYREERKAKEGRMVKEERMVKEVDKAKKAQRSSSKLVDLASTSRLIRELTSSLPITPKSVRST